MAPGTNLDNFNTSNEGQLSPRDGSKAINESREISGDAFLAHLRPVHEDLEKSLHNLHAVIENTAATAQWHKERASEIRHVGTLARGHARLLADLGESQRRYSEQRRRAESYEKDAYERDLQVALLRSLILDGQLTKDSFLEIMRDYFRLPSEFDWTHALKGPGREIKFTGKLPKHLKGKGSPEKRAH